MEISMKENGRMVSRMVKEHLFGLIEINMKENTRTESNTAKEH